MIIAVYANKSSLPYGNCWKHVQEEAVELSRKLSFTNSISDNLIANGLVYREDAIEMRKILGKEEWNKQHTEWLLMKVLPKTDNLGYFKFCCLLRVKFNLGEIGNRFCKGCDNFSLENCTIHDKSVLFVDSSSCQPLLQHSIMEHMSKHTYVSVNYSSNLEREFVFNSSIVCLDNKIFVDLIFNIDERYIDKEILGRQFVIRTFSDNSDVELHVYDKVDGINRTSMLLSMSAVAGMQLLSVMGEETSKDEFGTMLISLALSSKVGRKVFIQLTLSDMPPESPFVMNVMPKAKFSIKSDRDDNYYFINGNIYEFCRLCICINYKFFTLKNLI